MTYTGQDDKNKYTYMVLWVGGMTQDAKRTIKMALSFWDEAFICVSVKFLWGLSSLCSEDDDDSDIQWLLQFCIYYVVASHLAFRNIRN